MADIQTDKLAANAAALLREMVSVQSFSGEERDVSALIKQRLAERGIEMNTLGNNLWSVCKNFNHQKPVLMLNSHIDTVRPSSGYTFDPLNPPVSDDMVRGLGSNDAGASVVTMAETFCHFYEKEIGREEHQASEGRQIRERERRRGG
jgi:acetylornithine deacetylase